MITKPVLVDTGPIVAIFGRNDSYHAVCADQFKELSPNLYTSWPVITEAAWLLRNEPDRFGKLLDACTDAPFHILTLDGEDLSGIKAIMDKYRDQQIQLADASILYLAERERIDTVFTIDRRDFAVFRTAKGKSLQVLPP